MLLKLKQKKRAENIISAYDGWLNKTDKVLDVGCGNCIVTKHIQEMIGCDIQGYDVIDCGNNTDIPVTIGNINEFNNNSFDVILLNSVLHHTTNEGQKKLLLECSRIAKRILIFEVEKSPISKIIDYLLNLHTYKGKFLSNTMINHKSFFEWLQIFNKCYGVPGFNYDIEHRIIKIWYYPWRKFAFKLEKFKHLNKPTSL